MITPKMRGLQKAFRLYVKEILGEPVRVSTREVRRIVVKAEELFDIELAD